MARSQLRVRKVGQKECQDPKDLRVCQVMKMFTGKFVKIMAV